MWVCGDQLMQSRLESTATPSSLSQQHVELLGRPICTRVQHHSFHYSQTKDIVHLSPGPFIKKLTGTFHPQAYGSAFKRQAEVSHHPSLLFLLSFPPGLLDTLDLMHSRFSNVILGELLSLNIKNCRQVPLSSPFPPCSFPVLRCKRLCSVSSAFQSTPGTNQLQIATI